MLFDRYRHITFVRHGTSTVQTLIIAYYGNKKHSIATTTSYSTNSELLRRENHKANTLPVSMLFIHYRFGSSL
ncbi:hypothetical protein HanIR_Chr14g0715151 [Helianthus annuus]|nr:hypothetical protein HanIR_Chr14g0715151 [Helianthus annuus]